MTYYKLVNNFEENTIILHSFLAMKIKLMSTFLSNNSYVINKVEIIKIFQILVMINLIEISYHILNCIFIKLNYDIIFLIIEVLPVILI